MTDYLQLAVPPGNAQGMPYDMHDVQYQYIMQTLVALDVAVGSALDPAQVCRP